MLDGLLVVDKPAGLTSHDVVARVRRAAQQRRVGHAGTLDPDATGVLLVGLGRVTRLLRFLQITTKAYRAEIVFGISTDTLDAAGRVLQRRSMVLSEEEIVAATAGFLGAIEQVPPMVSAVKVGGRRLHDLARQGHTIERAARRVRVDRFDVEHVEDGEYPVATALVECGSGTYVRSLAADLGEALGGVAHLRALRRLRVGSFTLDDAIPLDAVTADPRAALMSPRTAMRHLQVVSVDADTARTVAHGAKLPGPMVPPDDAPGPFAVVEDDGELVAVYERRGDALQPAVVIAG